MGTKTIRLEDAVYERIAARKREDETFSEAIERLTGGYSLLDFAGGYTEKEAEQHRRLLEQADELAMQERKELVSRLDAGK